MKIIIKYIAAIFLLATLSLPASSTFSGSRLEQSLISYIESNIKGESRILLLSEIKDFKFNVQNITASIEHHGELRGFTHIYLIFRDDNKIVKEVKIAVRIRLFDKVLTFNKAMRAGQQISDNDLKFAEMEVTDILMDELPERNNLIGKVLSNSVTTGKIVTIKDLAEDIIIARGDKIAIVVQSGAVQIRTNGTALNDAKAGEDIRVKRDGTQNMILHGKAAGDGSVYITSNSGLAR